jgi:hypothetical protein
MKTTAISTLTAADVAFVLEVLQQAQDMSPTADAYDIGILRARAFAAASRLRIHSGIESVIVPIKEEAS